MLFQDYTDESIAEFKAWFDKNKKGLVDTMEDVRNPLTGDIIVRANEPLEFHHVLEAFRAGVTHIEYSFCEICPKTNQGTIYDMVLRNTTL